MSETLSQTLARNPLTAAVLAPNDAVPALDASSSGLSKDAALTFLELVKALIGRNAQSNASGTTTVSPTALCLQHIEILTFTGAGSTTRNVVLDTDTIPPRGAIAIVRCLMPATADITVEFYNESVSGAPLTSFITDNSGDARLAMFESDGTAWNFLRFDSYASA